MLDKNESVGLPLPTSIAHHGSILNPSDQHRLFRPGGFAQKHRSLIFTVGLILSICSLIIYQKNISKTSPNERFIFSTSALIASPSDTAQQNLNPSSPQTRAMPSRWSRVLTHNPSEESVLVTRLPRGYHGGESLPLVQVVAFEVRRHRRREFRSAEDPIVPSLDDLKRHTKRARSGNTAGVDSPLIPKVPSLSLSKQFTGNLPFYSDPAHEKAYRVPMLHRENDLWNAHNQGHTRDQSSWTRVPRSVVFSNFLRNLLFCESIKIVLCVPHYAGDVAMRDFLSKVDGCKIISKRNDIPAQEPDSLLAKVSDYSIRDRERILTDAEVVRVALVRNPISRLVSMYLENIAAAEFDSTEYRDFVGKVRGKALEANEKEIQKMSFALFVMHLSKLSAGIFQGGLFESQVSTCGLEMLDYDGIVRYEDLHSESELLAFLRKVRLERFRDRFPDLNSSAIEAQVQWASESESLAANAKTSSRLAKTYANDFSILGYARNAH